MNEPSYGAFTPTYLKECAKQHIAAGRPKVDGPSDLIGLPRFSVKDLESDVDRTLAFTGNDNATILWVWEDSSSPTCVEKIDLNDPDAQDKLSRFERS
jgi:hypothetical protein